MSNWLNGHVSEPAASKYESCRSIPRTAEQQLVTREIRAIELEDHTANPRPKGGGAIESTRETRESRTIVCISHFFFLMSANQVKLYRRETFSTFRDTNFTPYVQINISYLAWAGRK